jgi:uncharacterized protein (UPF0548 family)
MFRLSRATANEIEKAAGAARDLAPSSPTLLTLEGGLVEPLPRGFAHDTRESMLGAGKRDFDAACEAFDQWLQFDLGWVRVANPSAPVAKEQIVAVEAHTLGLWSLNLSVITDVVRTPRKFGFLYTTSQMHVEIGQERFILQLGEDGAVTYLIEAVSRPRNVLARAGYPVTRMMQKRFARQSHERMWQALARAMA